MRAAVFREHGKDVMVEETPKPAIEGGRDVLVEVKACGICGSDLAILEGRHHSKPPVILGHELSGVVDAVGPDVQGITPGDHVVVDPNLSCGSCVECRLGRRNMCQRMVELGITRDGGFAEALRAPLEAVYKIDDRISWKAAALVEPLSCVVHGFAKTRIKPEETAVVYGAGPMGLLWISLLKRAGARKVISVEPAERRRAAARDLGADLTVDPAAQDPVHAVSEATDGRGADVAVEMVGRRETTESGVRSVGAGGRVVVMGVARHEVRSVVSPFEIMANEIEILGSNANSYGFVPAIRMVESNALPVEKIVSHELSLEGIQEAFNMCRSGEALKVLVHPERR
jgi:2-desacetyl-2-hydroxyethyl bacteriochlorophyllide A dehydrogenase